MVLAFIFYGVWYHVALQILLSGYLLLLRTIWRFHAQHPSRQVYLLAIEAKIGQTDIFLCFNLGLALFISWLHLYLFA